MCVIIRLITHHSFTFVSEREGSEDCLITSGVVAGKGRQEVTHDRETGDREQLSGNCHSRDAMTRGLPFLSLCLSPDGDAEINIRRTSVTSFYVLRRRSSLL